MKTLDDQIDSYTHYSNDESIPCLCVRQTNTFAKAISSVYQSDKLPSKNLPLHLTLVYIL